VYDYNELPLISKGAITSKLKHAIKLKTSPATLAQLFLHQCCIPHYHFILACSQRRRIGCKLKQNANEGCNSCTCKSCGTCFKFYCMFYFTCDRSLTKIAILSRVTSSVHSSPANAERITTA